MLQRWGYVLRRPSLGSEPNQRGRSKGEVHIFSIYTTDSKSFQVNRLKTLGQVHYTKPVRTTDGQPPELRPFTYTKTLVLIPIDAISVEKIAHTVGLEIKQIISFYQFIYSYIYLDEVGTFLMSSRGYIFNVLSNLF